MIMDLSDNTRVSDEIEQLLPTIIELYSGWFFKSIVANGVFLSKHLQKHLHENKIDNLRNMNMAIQRCPIKGLF